MHLVQLLIPQPATISEAHICHNPCVSRCRSPPQVLVLGSLSPATGSAGCSASSPHVGPRHAGLHTHRPDEQRPLKEQSMSVTHAEAKRVAADRNMMVESLKPGLILH